jgi:ABC-2 type transport system permease protein
MKAHRNSLIGWSLGMVILVASGMAKFSALSSSGQTANDMLKAFPKSVLAILGVQDFDLKTAIGYFGVLFIYLVLMAAIHAAMIGAEIVSKEERDRTSEFLFSKPISRARALTEKLLAALTNVVVLNMVTAVSSIIMVGVFANNYSNNNIILVLMAGLLLVQLIFLSIGASLAGLFKNPKLPSVVATTILLATYIILVVMNLNSKFNNLKYLTPFKYFDANIVIRAGNLDVFYIVLSLIIIVVLTIVAYLSFSSRDLQD